MRTLDKISINMDSGGPVEHIGIIQKLEGFTAQVTFTVQSSCTDCHAKGVCSVAGMKEKTIDVKHTGNFERGERVMIILKKSLGYKALMLGYILPFFIVLLSLILFVSLFESELLAGMYSIILLAPYYLILFLIRDKISKEFSFTIRKLT